MRDYVATFIFRSSLKDEELEEIVEHVAEQIRRHEGTPAGTEKLGKRAFARPLSNTRDHSGHYVRIRFGMDPAQVEAFRERFRHREEIVRIQIIADNRNQPDPDTQSAPAEAAPEDTTT